MLKKYVKPHIGVIVIAVLMMFVSAYCELLPPYFLSVVLDKCLPEKNYNLLFIIVGLLIAVAVVVCLFMRIRSVITNKMAMKIIQDIRSDLFAHMQKLPFSFFDSPKFNKTFILLNCIAISW